jgi:hypothetical protein|tara:strand:+ start:4988 stop:5545 length:558 start_codon:yes stop_codon:yes gene_type:complete
MSDIKVIKTGINVSKMLKQINQYPEDWGGQKKMKDADSLLNYGYQELSADVLQLVIGGVESVDQYVGDTEICVPTPAYERHTEMINFMKRHFPNFKRCGYLSLPIGGVVDKHIDVGTYYLDKDRFHLAIQGKYEYSCGDDTVLVEPGTLLWFNNKKMHGTVNVGDVTRITFVFDVPHKKNKPYDV